MRLISLKAFVNCLALLILLNQCLIVSQQDKCYADLERLPAESYCRLALAAPEEEATEEERQEANTLMNFGIINCLIYLQEEEKCKSESKIIPDIQQ